MARYGFSISPTLVTDTRLYNVTNIEIICSHYDKLGEYTFIYGWIFLDSMNWTQKPTTTEA